VILSRLDLDGNEDADADGDIPTARPVGMPADETVLPVRMDADDSEPGGGVEPVSWGSDWMTVSATCRQTGK
jgi:hypothetical protein